MTDNIHNITYTYIYIRHFLLLRTNTLALRNLLPQPLSSSFLAIRSLFLPTPKKKEEVEKNQEKIQASEREREQEKIHVVQLELAFSGELLSVTTTTVIN